MLSLNHYFITAYQPKSNGQVEWFHKTSAARLRHYVEENQSTLVEFLQPLTYDYNLQVHCFLGTTPFDFVLSRHPPDIIDQQGPNNRRAAGTQWTTQVTKDILQRLRESLRMATGQLINAEKGKQIP